MSENNIEQQRQDIDKLFAQIETGDTEEIKKVLSQREIVNPEPELTPDIINRLKAKIKNKKP